MVDDDGYPIEIELKEIETFDIEKQPIEHLLDLLEKIWWASEWGFKREIGKNILDSPCIKLELHTGGWSGNEDIIEALKKTKMFWFLFWQKSERGGHYYFEITNLYAKVGIQNGS
jgi:hypothetical protein